MVGRGGGRCPVAARERAMGGVARKSQATVVSACRLRGVAKVRTDIVGPTSLETEREMTGVPASGRKEGQDTL